MKMAMNVKSLYEAENLPEYVESLHSPFRRKYETDIGIFMITDSIVNYY